MRGEQVLLLKKLARYKHLTDGAKVTLLEFLYHFWSEDKLIPSYGELCEARNTVRSTIQLHVGELEKCGIVKSIHLPNNRKRYIFDPMALDSVPVKLKKSALKTEDGFTLRKGSHKYSTAELCGYFMFLLKGVGKIMPTHTRQEYRLMKMLQAKHGSSEIVKAMETFKRLYTRKHWPFKFSFFLEQAESLIQNRG